jgi:hypothetical protein
MAIGSESNPEAKGFATYKQNFGIENERIEKCKKGNIIQEIDNIEEYLNNP